ncbi:hypothetical protein SBD_3193 [Streptomyces bottropensis ATCC 25435]|uniref:Uncharacterized protein n=1 Tax=Streptomyces bottropensis ATCC 25435 TaxID=1054862 RepID=M3FSC7_9ACTN|nr:hypothetical protein SBD_3193 [Streptomyces bottropensis ATCC 25435]
MDSLQPKPLGMRFGALHSGMTARAVPVIASSLTRELPRR